MQEEKDLEQLKDNTMQNELEQSKTLIITKEKQSEELLCKLSVANNEIYEYKSNIDMNDNILKSKNEEIRELRTDNINYINRLSNADTKIQLLKSELEIRKDIIRLKNIKIEELSASLLDKINQLSSAEEHTKVLQIKIQDQDKIIKEYIEQNEKLLSQFTGYISFCEEVENDLVAKNKEVQELNSKIDYQKQLNLMLKASIIKKQLTEKTNLDNHKRNSNFWHRASQLRKTLSLSKLYAQLLIKSTMELQKVQGLKYEEIKNVTEHLRKSKNEVNIHAKQTEYIAEVTNLKSLLMEKDEIITKSQNYITNLKYQYSNQLQESKLQIEKLSETASEYEIIKINLKIVEDKTFEYMKKIISLEQQLLYANDQVQHMNQVYEFSTMKKRIENDLHKKTHEKLCESKAAEAKVQLLEKEKEKYSTSRLSEESVEKEKFKGVKRQRLQDSSRSLNRDEHVRINDENPPMNLSSFESNKSTMIDIQTSESERSKQRMSLADSQIDEQLCKKND